MAFSIDKLTMGEIALYEERSGQSIAQFGDPEKPLAKAMQVMYFIMKRREDKTFNLKDTDDLTMDQITEGLGLKAEEDPNLES